MALRRMRSDCRDRHGSGSSLRRCCVSTRTRDRCRGAGLRSNFDERIDYRDYSTISINPRRALHILPHECFPDGQSERESIYIYFSKLLCHSMRLIF